MHGSQVDYALSLYKKKNAAFGDAAPRLCPELDNTYRNGAFRISGSGEGVLCVKGDEEGIRCGIFSLMREMGFRWFNPADEMKVPAHLEPLGPDFPETVHSPDFPYRTLHICSMPDHYDKRVCEWMSFNRLNVKQAEPREYDRLKDELKCFGLVPVYGSHAFFEIIPPEKYFSVHPEFFAFIGGKRSVIGAQLCLSNLQMRETYLKEIRIRAADRPEIRFWSLFPNDGHGWCECNECRALDTPEDRCRGTVNGRYADFVQWICRKAPELYFRSGSYAAFPDFTDCIADPIPNNLCVSCTMLDRCLSHPISSPECPANSELAERLRRMTERGFKVQVGDYYSYRWQTLPAPLWQTIAQDFRNWRRQGVYGFSCEVSGAESPTWTYYWQSLFLAAEMMWDCSRSSDEILEDICRHSFGPAADSVFRYYRALSEHFSDRCFLKKPDDFQRIIRPGLETLVKATGAASEIQKFEYWQGLLRERVTAVSEREIRPNKLPPQRKLVPQKICFVYQNSLVPDYENPTSAAVFANRNVFLIQVDAYEQNMDKLVTGGWCQGDTIEIFLSDGRNSEGCFHFLVGCAGEVNAAESLGPRWNWSWKHHAQAKITRYADRWHLDFQMPFSDIYSRDGSFGFSLIRYRNAGIKFRYSTGAPDGGVYFETSRYIHMNPFENLSEKNDMRMKTAK